MIARLFIFLFFFCCFATPSAAQSPLDGAATQQFNGRNYYAFEFETLSRLMRESCFYNSESELRGARVAVIASMRVVQWPMQRIGRLYVDDFVTPTPNRTALLIPAFNADITAFHDEMAEDSFFQGCEGFNLRYCHIAAYGVIEYYDRSMVGGSLWAPRCMLRLEGYRKILVRDEGDGLPEEMVRAFVNGYAWGSSVAP